MKLITKQDLEKWSPKEARVAIRPLSEYASAWITMCLANPFESEGMPFTCWPGMTRAFGGSRPELIVLTGETGRGKSTFGFNWMMDVLSQNRPALSINLEGGPPHILEALGLRTTGKRVRDNTNEDKKLFLEQMNKLPLYLLDHAGQLHEDFIVKSIEYCAQELGVQFVLLDHLDYIEKNWNTKKESSYVIRDTVCRLAGTASKNHCTILLICHPKGIEQQRGRDGKAKETREVGMNDLKGSSGIKQEAGAVLSLYRPNPELGDTWVRFNKIRNKYASGSTGGRIKFRFNPKTQEYFEETGKLEWSGENEG